MAVKYYPWAANNIGDPSPDLYMEIAAGNIQGMMRAGGSMYNPTATTTLETLWPGSSRYVWPTAASTVTLSSDSAADGASVVIYIDGLAADFSQQYEAVSLNGTTPVSTTQQFFRINGISVVADGVVGTNTGNIYIGTGTVTAGRPAGIWNMIVAGEGVSSSGIYTVPKGYAAHLAFLQVGTESSKAGQLELRLQYPSGLKYLSNKWQVSSTLTLEPRGFGRATEGTDVEWACKLVSTTGAWSGFWGAILRKESD